MRAEDRIAGDKEAWLAATSCDDLQALRIQRQIREELDRSRARKASAQRATEVSQASVDRLRRRLAARPSAARRAAPLGWALAAAAVMALLGFFLGQRLPWPVDTPEPLRSGDVALELDGLGAVEGTAEQPVIQWTSGTVRVAVTPNRGVALSVVTPEATVRVVGTEFAVDRDDFATQVTVSHGTVEVICAGEAPIRVSAPESRTCLPEDAPTLLRRASALRRRGAPAEQRRIVIDRGLARAEAGSALQAELFAHRAELLSATGQDQAALEAARAYLAIGGPRNAEMTELAERLSLRLGAPP